MGILFCVNDVTGSDINNQKVSFACTNYNVCILREERHAETIARIAIEGW
jgi:hypothetical protein